jgi:hypothetical protein
VTSGRSSRVLVTLPLAGVERNLTTTSANKSSSSPTNRGVPVRPPVQISSDMEQSHSKDPEQLRQYAKELRERALTSELPGYAERLIKAAEDLEKHAALLESLM